MKGWTGKILHTDNGKANGTSLDIMNASHSISTGFSGTVQVTHVAGQPTDDAVTDVSNKIFDNSGSYTWQDGRYDDGDGEIAGQPSEDFGKYSIYGVQFQITF